MTMREHIEPAWDGRSRIELSSQVPAAAAGTGMKPFSGTVRRGRGVVHIVFAGPTGKVGRALLGIFEERRRWFRQEQGIEVRIVGGINTKRMIWNVDGIPPSALLAELKIGSDARWERFADLMRSEQSAPVIFLDCTASTALAREYIRLLESGIAVVTPNKIANALEYGYYQALRRLGRRNGRRYLYETTVGAATPMLQTLEDLRRTGDTIRKIEGVLSGTLSYVFGRMNAGERFSVAVREAVELGLAEPHPAMDLSGEDVARKLLILAREAGYRLERGDVLAESLISGDFRVSTDTCEFIQDLGTLDGHWRDRVQRARRNGRALTYLASFDGSEARVGPAEVLQDSPFIRLQPTENAVHYYSDRHFPLPLTIQGTGAGPDITARGVVADIFHTALEIAA